MNEINVILTLEINYCQLWFLCKINSDFYDSGDNLFIENNQFSKLYTYIIHNSWVFERKFSGYRCESDMAIFA